MSIHKRAIDALLKDMAKFEIVKRSINPIKTLWWYYWPGTKITVKWPRGWVVVQEMRDGSKTSIQSSDPNDHFRGWLEQNVGKQGWDWDWRIENSNVTDDSLTIKFRKGKSKYASYCSLKWN